ncbi:MAG: hypothetical protein AAF357_02885 [Verrucomicrobiota bacterium]
MRTETEEKSGDEMEEVLEADISDPIEVKRKGIIGRKFESLTLGARLFYGAEIRDITDREIVVAHADGVDQIPWSEVPEVVRSQWGYRAESNSLSGKMSEAVAGLLESKETVESPDRNATQEDRSGLSAVDLAAKRKQISMKEQMLKAQLAGVQVLESDLSRHSISLNSMRAQLQSVRALQSGQRSGGIRVERIGGESTLVDRRKQARELEAKIKVEEQLVSQLSQSLQAARIKYQTLNRELAALRQ